jgi:excisionase family DNA binding protein
MPQPRARAQPAPKHVSTRRACAILGVNPSTLRQWTDEGRVAAYMTPGGHRRYDVGALQALVERGTPRVPTPPLFASLYQYEAVVRRCLEVEPWFQNFDGAARQQFRILGSSMLHLLGAYVLAGSDGERAASLARAREVASSHGLNAAAAGLGVTDAMRAFLVFRAPVMETLAEWSRLGATESARLAEMLRRVNEFMDEVLLAMVAAHSEASRGARAAL